MISFVLWEGCFFVEIYKSSTTKTGEAVRLVFNIAQHVRDEQLLKNIINYLGCGRYSHSSNQS